jgi:hypothetical protein
MKFTPLALVVLFASLAFSQTVTPTPAPAPPSATAPAPAPAAQPIIEAGGLDNICQSGLTNEYKMNDDHTFGTNNPAESLALSNASACIGYITGWEHTISGAFIIEEDQLWFVEVSDSFTALAAVDALHQFLVANPDARTASSPLILLNVAVDKKMATVSPVKIENLPHGQPQSEPNPSAPVLKSKA